MLVYVNNMDNILRIYHEAAIFVLFSDCPKSPMWFVWLKKPGFCDHLWLVQSILLHSDWFQQKSQSLFPKATPVHFTFYSGFAQLHFRGCCMQPQFQWVTHNPSKLGAVWVLYISPPILGRLSNLIQLSFKTLTHATSSAFTWEALCNPYATPNSDGFGETPQKLHFIRGCVPPQLSPITEEFICNPLANPIS